MTRRAANLHFWHGENDFEMHRELIVWKKTFTKKYTNLNIIEIESNETDTAILRQAWLSQALFGDIKLILLKNILIQTDSTPLTKQLSSLIASVPPNIFVLFWQTEKIKAVNLSQQLTAMANSQKIQQKKFDLPIETELNNWIKEYCNLTNVMISRPAITLLLKKSGVVVKDQWKKGVNINIWLLATELDKLIAASFPKNSIDEKLIAEVVSEIAEYHLWNLINALIDKNANEALNLLEQRLTGLPQTAHAGELRTILNLWSNQLRKLILIKSTSSQTDLDKLTLKLKWSKGQTFIIQKQAGSYSKKQLLGSRENLITLFKTSLTDPKILKAKIALTLA